MIQRFAARAVGLRHGLLTATLGRNSVNGVASSACLSTSSKSVSIARPIAASQVPLIVSSQNTVMSSEIYQSSFECLGRNNRKIKKANHGKKPCNRMKRKKKRLRTNGGW